MEKVWEVFLESANSYLETIGAKLAVECDDDMYYHVKIFIQNQEPFYYALNLFENELPNAITNARTKARLMIKNEREIKERKQMEDAAGKREKLVNITIIAKVNTARNDHSEIVEELGVNLNGEGVIEWHFEDCYVEDAED